MPQPEPMNSNLLSPDIIFFRIPICPKCKVVDIHLKALKEENPKLTVRELNLLTNLGLARKHGIMTVPALIVKDQPLTGLVSKEDILEILENRTQD